MRERLAKKLLEHLVGIIRFIIFAIVLGSYMIVGTLMIPIALLVYIFRGTNLIGAIAEWYGREFKKVNPSYTSQECSNCGYTDKNNRKTQSKFKCLSCGHEENADRNAAKVIKGRGTSNLYANVEH